MKKSAFFYFSLAAIFAGNLSSCQDYDAGFDEFEIKYQNEFIKEFGKPAADHKWGFEDIPINPSFVETRTADPNANQWAYNGLDVPYPLSTVQKDFVTEWFETHQNPTGIAVSWTDYFAQQVSSTEYGENMDYLLDDGPTDNDHIYNFNKGNCSENSNVTAPWLPNGNPSSQNGWPEYKDRIQYMTGQSTKAFSYHETVSDKTWDNHYVIIPGEMIDPTDSLGQISTVVKDSEGNEVLDKSGNSITTTESIWGMWFVAFDYEADGQSADQKVSRDYYFNDWIIRISPGTYSTKSQRVMCEDLGNSFDWDFNDVVFDAYIEGHGNARVAHISIQCAGGTLPIIVGTTDSSYEIHSLFGAKTSEVVIRPKAPAQYTVDLPNGQGNTTNVKTIPIYVNGTNVTAIDLSQSNVPQRFACPVGTDWQDELKCITLKYPQFPNWVTDPDNAKNVWTYHPEHNFDK